MVSEAWWVVVCRGGERKKRVGELELDWEDDGLCMHALAMERYRTSSEGPRRLGKTLGDMSIDDDDNNRARGEIEKLAQAASVLVRDKVAFGIMRAGCPATPASHQ